MRLKTLVRMANAFGALAVLSAAHGAAAATTVTSYSTGLDANLTVLNLISAGIGPIDLASGTAPSTYSVNQTLASADASADLLVGSLGATTGVIVDTAASPYVPTASTLSGTATSTVNGLGTNLSVPVVGSLLDITATTLTSTSNASDIGASSFSGSSEINNLYISGTALGGPGIHLNASGLAATPVDDVLANVGGLEIIANYQTPIYNGKAQDGIQTAALVIAFNDYLLGGQLLTGDVAVADSAAFILDGPSVGPEPAAWAMMLIGFGVLGATFRRRRVAAAV
jgi:hypothetical protein